MNKKFTKSLGLLLTAVVTLALFSGCSGKNGKTVDGVLNNGSSSKHGKTIKVKYWSHSINLKDLQTQLISEYNASNKDGIEIEFNMVGDKYGDMLSLAMASDEGPDVFTIPGPSLTRKAVEMKWAEPLDTYMTPEFKKRFIDGVWVENTNVLNGSVYTLPDSASTYRMIYNKNLFIKAGLDPEKPPKTLAELRQYAKQIKALGDEFTGLGIPMGDSYYIDVMVMNGIGTASLGLNGGYDYRKGQFDFEAFKPLLTSIKDIRKDGSMLKGELLLKAEQGRAEFIKGTVGITAAPSWEVAIYDEANLAFDLGICDFPTLDGNFHAQPIISIGSGYSMSAKTEDKKVAWKVMNHIFSKDFMGVLTKKTGMLTLLKDIESDEAFKADLKYLDAFIPRVSDAIWPPVVPGLVIQGDDKQTVFIKIIVDDGNLDMDKELSDLSRRYNTALEKSFASGALSKEVFIRPDFDPLNVTR